MVTEISYAVAPDARGFGVAAEAVDALAIALILEHGFQRIELRVAPGNTASRRVAEKAGFSYEGLLRNAGLGAQRAGRPRGLVVRRRRPALAREAPRTRPAPEASTAVSR